MDSRQLRAHLGRWATGIAVITTIDRVGLPLGKTANSFHAVSLDPPLVSWCVDVASTRYAEWLAAPTYAVHVLSDEQSDLVTRFATTSSDKFAGLNWTSGPGGVPLLDGAHLRIIASVTDRHPAGDHTYLIGSITDIHVTEQSIPLLFHGGSVIPLVHPELTCHER